MWSLMNLSTGSSTSWNKSSGVNEALPVIVSWVPGMDIWVNGRLSDTPAIQFDPRPDKRIRRSSPCATARVRRHRGNDAQTLSTARTRFNRDDTDDEPIRDK